MGEKMKDGIRKRPDRPSPFSVGWRDPESKRLRWRSFKTEEEAKAFRDTVRVDIRQGTYVDPRPIPFRDFALDWLARRRPTVSPNTAALHEWAVQKYLIPAFGPIPLQRLGAERIERWQADLLSRGEPGPRSVEICRTVLGTLLKDARQKGRIYVNPMEAVRRFPVPKRELRYLTAEQVRLLCEHVGRVYGVLFLVMAFCGLRIGEALGLRWSDLDARHRRLLIQRQVIWRRKKDCKAGEPRWAIAEPKSEAGQRAVEIPAPLFPFLEAHRETQNGSPNPLGLVFPSEDGTPLYPGNVRSRHFAPALKALGVEGIRPHDFRRTFIALHVEAGTHPKQIQERVGHSSIKLTMDVYGKLAGKMALGAEQAARLDALATKALPAPE
ncbi:MAG TPA: tyrosine-type recombinase/integrase [Candidatus Methylomirabilis sp.]|jgi:integrase|nr:tyrosine-type recombinase/integrase [Candidatus Methylomirabilis sp.]